LTDKREILFFYSFGCKCGRVVWYRIAQRNGSKKRKRRWSKKRWSFESDRHLCERLRRLSIGSDFCGTRRQMKSVCLARLRLAWTQFIGW